MDRIVIETNYVDGKRVSEIEETAGQSEDERYLGQLRERKANALEGIEREPDNTYWRAELEKVNKEIPIYQAFVDGYPEIVFD